MPKESVTKSEEVNVIKLPEKVKCWKCGVTGDITLETGLDGPCDCVTEFGSRGYRYNFDDLAAAVRDAELEIDIEEIFMDARYFAQILETKWDGEPVSYIKAKGRGPTPTAALLNAINKFIEEASNGT